MKKLLKIAIAVIAVLAIAKPLADNQETVKVKIFKGEYASFISDETKQIIGTEDKTWTNKYTSLIGQEIDEEFVNDNEEKIYLDNNSVILVTSSDCIYCQKMVEKVLKINANKKTYIYTTYEEHEPISEYINNNISNSSNYEFLKQNNSIDFLLYSKEIYEAPILLFVDGNKINMALLGEHSENQISDLIYHLENNKLYNIETEDGTLGQFIRKQEIVKKYIENLREIQIPEEKLKGE